MSDNALPGIHWISTKRLPRRRQKMRKLVTTPCRAFIGYPPMPFVGLIVRVCLSCDNALPGIHWISTYVYAEWPGNDHRAAWYAGDNSLPGIHWISTFEGSPGYPDGVRRLVTTPCRAFIGYPQCQGWNTVGDAGVTTPCRAFIGYPPTPDVRKTLSEA